MKADLFSTIGECQKKAFLQRLGLGSSSNKNKHATVKFLMKKIITSNFSYDWRQEIETSLTREMYLSNCEREEDISLLKKQLSRYLDYENVLKRKILLTNGSVNLLLSNSAIEVNYDIIFDNKKNVEIIKFIRNGPDLSKKARKPENKPENSIELYLLYKAGKQLFPDKNIVASFYHLKSKNDKGDVFVDLFEAKEGYNVISHTYDELKSKEIERTINDLLQIKLNVLSDETMDSGSCRNCYLKKVCDRAKQKTVIPKIPHLNELVKASGEVRLTDAQREAVMFEEGIARVNAGAGTGKTTTIALRVVELLKKGVAPESILLITFTRKAVEEMYEKISFWTKVFELDVSVKSLNIFTFNSFGMKVLKENVSLLGYRENLKLATKITKYDLIFELLDETPIDNLDMKNPLLNFPHAKGAVITVNDCLNFIKIHNLSKEDSIHKLCEYNSYPIETNEEIYSIYESYNEILKSKNIIEYQDQLKLSIDILDNHPELKQRYGYTHIMIDEYQDTDPTQVRLVKLLKDTEFFKSLVVVGDDAQAIYRFRLADQGNLVYFDTEFDNVVDITMVHNYRSTQNILTASNLLIENNKTRIIKDLVSGNNVLGELPQLYEYEEKTNEYKSFINIIKKHVEDGNQLSDITIIARTGSELIEIGKILEKQGIPAQFQLTMKLIDYKPIQDIMAIARLCIDKSDTISGAQIALSDASNETLLELSNQTDVEFMSYVLDKINELCIPDTDEDKLSYFFEYVKNKYELDDTIQNFITSLEDDGYENIEQLVSTFNKMELYEDDTPLDVEENQFHAVNLITAHSSKGKEYNVVIVVLDKFETNIDLENEEEVEEQRRLLFVAMTRAKKHLYLTYYRKDKLSRFIDELQNVEVTKFR